MDFPPLSLSLFTYTPDRTWVFLPGGRRSRVSGAKGGGGSVVCVVSSILQLCQFRQAQALPVPLSWKSPVTLPSGTVRAKLTEQLIYLFIVCFRGLIASVVNVTAHAYTPDTINYSRSSARLAVAVLGSDSHAALDVFRIIGRPRHSSGYVYREIDDTLAVWNDRGDAGGDAVACGVRARGVATAVYRRFVGLPATVLCPVALSLPLAGG